MAWIELHQSLTTHKKTRRLARALGLGVPEGIPQTIGHLCMFWLWCVDGTDNGSLEDFYAQDIADAAGWTGDADVFLAAMVDTGFIDRGPDGLEIHDWDDYIGRLITYREKERERNRKKSQRHRERVKAKKLESEAPDAADATEEADAQTLIDPEWMKVVKCYESNIGMVPIGASGEMLVSYMDDLGADVVCKAIEVTNKANANNPFKYLKAVLDKWAELNIKTVEQAEAYCKDLERRLRKAKMQKQPEANEPPAISGDFY